MSEKIWVIVFLYQGELQENPTLFQEIISCKYIVDFTVTAISRSLVKITSAQRSGVTVRPWRGLTLMNWQADLKYAK